MNPTLFFNVAKIHAFFSEFCCTVAFASDDTPEPEAYLMLMRASTEENGGTCMGGLDWDLCVDFDGDIHSLCHHDLQADWVDFFFDDKAVCLRLPLPPNRHIDLRHWLNLLFHDFDTTTQYT